MYKCGACGNEFEEPLIIKEYHGMPGALYEELPVCPVCKEHFFVKMVRCFCCNEWTGDRYVRTEDGRNYCSNCFTIQEPEW